MAPTTCFQTRPNLLGQKKYIIQAKNIFTTNSNFFRTRRFGPGHIQRVYAVQSGWNWKYDGGPWCWKFLSRWCFEKYDPWRLWKRYSKSIFQIGRIRTNLQQPFEQYWFKSKGRKHPLDFTCPSLDSFYKIEYLFSWKWILTVFFIFPKDLSILRP